MENYDGGVSVYSEAKGEYTKQLTLFLVPSFHIFFMDCLDQAATEENLGKKQLWKFQELLSQIPEWNIDKVQRETQKLVGSIQCDYLEELVTAVFIAHTKVLTAIRIGNKNKRVQITIPKLEHFLHRSLSECSRLLWSSAYLFHNELSPIEKQKNHRQIEQLLHEGVAQAIRGLLPVKNILKDYLSDPNGGEDADDEGEEEKEAEKVKSEAEKVESVAEKVESVAEKVESVTEKVAEKVESVDENKKIEEPSTTPQIQQDVKPEVVIPVESKLEEAQSSVKPIAEQPQQPAPVQTLIVETEPSVRFTNFDQVIQERGGETQIGYVEKTETDENDMMHFKDDQESLSDFEDLTEYPLEPMGTDDFEVLT
jgi:hypothetical protein